MVSTPPRAPSFFSTLSAHAGNWRRASGLEREISRAGLGQLRDLAIRHGVASAGRALDYVVAPSFRAVKVEAPVFVVAPPRSGTTLLYNLLACDPRFAAPRLYESILPSVAVLGAIEQIGALADRLSRGSVSAGFERWELSQFAAIDSIHRVRYRELEEDTPLFDRYFACPTALRFFPANRDQANFALDDASPARRAAVMQSYYRAIQRILHRSKGRTYLAKNVASAGRIGSLLERFPDARMIHIVRHPYRVIPSAIRMLRACSYLGIPYEQRPKIPQAHPVSRAYGDVVIDAFRRLLRWEQQLPKQRWLTLRFEDLIADPGAAVDGLYRHFGLEMTSVAAAAIKAQAQMARSHRSGGSSPLEAFGYSREEVYRAIPEVFEAYGFER